MKKNRQFKSDMPSEEEIRQIAKITGRSYEDIKSVTQKMKKTIDRWNSLPMAPKKERERILQRFTDLQFAGQPGYERNELLGFHEDKDDE